MTTRSEFNHGEVDGKTLEELRATWSMKWSDSSEQHIGAAVAEMDLGTAPAIQRSLRALVEREVYGYLPARLVEELGNACADWQQSAYGWAVRPDRILPIADVLAAFEIVLHSFSSPSRPIIVPTPAYMPFLNIPTGIGRETIQVPMRLDSQGGWCLDLEGIEAAFLAGGHVFMLCNPHNPTGHVHRRAELLALCDIVEAHGGLVFSDEIHSPLVYPGMDHIPYASISDLAAGHSITATASSKAWNTAGLKCAQVVIPNDDLLDKWRRVAAPSLYSASNMGAVASISAYRDSRSWLSGAMRYLEFNRALLLSRLGETMPEVFCYPPDGTYLAWLDFRSFGLGDNPSVELRAHTGVATSPGPAFGEVGKGWVRFNFAMPTPFLEEALTRMARYVRTL